MTDGPKVPKRGLGTSPHSTTAPGATPRNLIRQLHARTEPGARRHREASRRPATLHVNGNGRAAGPGRTVLSRLLANGAPSRQ